MISIDEVSKSYGDKRVLHPLSLTIDEGTCMTLIGQSGCGKSTLIRLIIGLIAPDKGTIRFRDKVVSDEASRKRSASTSSQKELAELRHEMGYVVQGGGLFPHLTAGQNAALVATHLGWSNERIDQRLSELAELVHLPLELLQRYPSQLSGGQQQRVSLMRALLLDPELLLMDEPLGALDPLIRADLQSDLREIIKQLGKTAIIVTHDMGEAAYFGDQIVLLKDGRIVQQGAFDDFVAHPADEFVTRFISAQRSYLDEAQAS